MKIKLSHILIVVIALLIIFRKRIGAWLDSQQIPDATSAAEQTPLQNLQSSTANAQQAMDSVSKVASTLMDSGTYSNLVTDLKNDVYLDDLYDDLDNINTGAARPSSFLDTIRSQDDKILAMPDPTIVSAGTKQQRRRDQSWWSDVIYDTVPPWLTNYQGTCKCGCNGNKILHIDKKRS